MSQIEQVPSDSLGEQGPLRPHAREDRYADHPPDTPVPYAKSPEAAYIPGPAQIEAAVRSLM
jgi:hypothetical protein